MLYQSDQKARELRPRACKLLKTHAPNEVPSHKKHLRQLGIQRKKGRGPSNYRVWKRKRRVIRSWGAAVCLSGSFLSLSNPLSPHSSLSFFLPPLSVLVGPRPPGGWRVWPLGFWQMRLGHCVLARASVSLLLMVECGLQKSNSSERLESFVSASAWGLGLLWPCWNTGALAERRQSVSPREGQIKKQLSRAAGEKRGFRGNQRLAGAGFDTSYL